MKKALFTRDRYCKINPHFLSNDPYRVCGPGQVAKVAINKQKALDSAHKHLQKGQIDKAIVEFKKVCEADPEDLRVLQKLIPETQKKLCLDHVTPKSFFHEVAVKKSVFVPETCCKRLSPRFLLIFV